MRCYVIVGLIGSGKTTLAESMPCHYVGFDAEWHSTAQRGGLAPGDFVSILAERINGVAADVVIDGWWTWEWQWWLAANDTTLADLDAATTHAVQLVYLPVGPAKAWADYKRKLRARQYPTGSGLANAAAYRASIPERISYMSSKVSEWER